MVETEASVLATTFASDDEGCECESYLNNVDLAVSHAIKQVTKQQKVRNHRLVS